MKLKLPYYASHRQYQSSCEIRETQTKGSNFDSFQLWATNEALCTVRRKTGRRSCNSFRIDPKLSINDCSDQKRVRFGVIYHHQTSGFLAFKTGQFVDFFIRKTLHSSLVLTNNFSDQIPNIMGRLCANSHIFNPFYRPFRSVKFQPLGGKF